MNSNPYLGNVIFTLRSDRITIKRYKLFHRNKYMGEKIKYYQRINEAQTSGGRIWSFIFDYHHELK